MGADTPTHKHIRTTPTSSHSVSCTMHPAKRAMPDLPSHPSKEYKRIDNHITPVNNDGSRSFSYSECDIHNNNDIHESSGKTMPQKSSTHKRKSKSKRRKRRSGKNPAMDATQLSPRSILQEHQELLASYKRSQSKRSSNHSSSRSSALPRSSSTSASATPRLSHEERKRILDSHSSATPRCYDGSCPPSLTKFQENADVEVGRDAEPRQQQQQGFGFEAAGKPVLDLDGNELNLEGEVATQSVRMKAMGAVAHNNKQLDNELQQSITTEQLQRSGEKQDPAENGDSGNAEEPLRASRTAWGNLIKNSRTKALTDAEQASKAKGSVVSSKVKGASITTWVPGTVIKPNETVEYFQLVQAGQEDANGYYRPHPTRNSDGVPVYVNDWPLDVHIEMKRFAKGDKKYWGILRKQWKGNDKVDLYWTRSSDDWPPPRGWRCFNKKFGQVPSLKFVSQVFLRSFIHKTKTKEFDLDSKREASLMRYYGLVGKHGEKRKATSRSK